jgi:hypothetical protein
MNTIKTLILSGALVLTAGAALAQPAGATNDTQRIQESIYDAQSGERLPVLREGRASAVGAAPVRQQENVREPFYFSQASSGSDRNAN